MRTLHALLLTAAAAAALSGCTFHRVQSNAAFETLDPTPLRIHESTFEDVLNRLGPPSSGTVERIRDATSMVSFRYMCADEKSFDLLLSYGLILPFRWGDKRTGRELVVEFDGKGVVSDIYVVSEEAAWRPFSEPSGREVTFFGREGTR